MSVFIIAEAGVNHNGEETIAKELIDIAVSSGADAVKFQTFLADELTTKAARQASYQEKNTNRDVSQYEMLKELELSFDSYIRLAEYAKEAGIEFMSTAFDDLSFDFLVKDMRLSKLKVPSGDITNAPFLYKHGQAGVDLILSTGMSTLEEVRKALNVIALGVSGEKIPQSGNIPLLGHDTLREVLAGKLTLLHCTTEYPAPIDSINLNAMRSLSDEFGLPVGYSDHSEGIVVPIAAVAMGATVIEKHFTLSRDMMGPDHKASMEPKQFKEMIEAIRSVEVALGNGLKVPVGAEIENRKVARKSLVASTNIKKGEPFSEDNISIKRPGNGVSPFEYWSILTKRANRDFSEGELIEHE